MARLREAEQGEDGSAARRSTSGSAAGRAKRRPTASRRKTVPAAEPKETGAAAERKKTASAAGRGKTGAAAERKKTGAGAAREKAGSAAGRRRTASAERKKTETAEGRRKSRPTTRRNRSGRGLLASLRGLAFGAGGVLAAIGVLALAGWLLTFPLGDFRYSSGMSGTPGTFTAAQCHTTGAGKNEKRVCTGTFVAAKGGIVDGSARISDARVDVGKPVKLRRRPDGGYVHPGAMNAGMNLATAFGIVSLAAFLLVVLCVSPGRVSAGSYKRLRKNPPPWGTLLTVLVPVFGVSLALAALCAVVGFLLSLIF
ncbi:hypothetical protein NE235_24445 [Actinoallomurus spadix]|uniref:Uncharacterized protein n=1 Tax=Actinoallomurus spadix TaxID=79912 RepID=A0ABP3FZ06_9ACTN|nr:hypothetical protein [Actinoallomurus spadix]MCO5989260.1 hypothetical protein [Actinoallomurus spadix]